jgi:hypothetical protein
MRFTPMVGTSSLSPTGPRATSEKRSGSGVVRASDEGAASASLRPPHRHRREQGLGSAACEAHPEPHRRSPVHAAFCSTPKLGNGYTTIRRIEEHRGRVFCEEWVGELIADSGHRGGCGGLVNSSASHKRSPLRFFVLVFALSIPIWLIAQRGYGFREYPASAPSRGNRPRARRLSPARPSPSRC